MVKVVFRKWYNGDIIALFPQEPADRYGMFCQSYEHIGQHGGADYDGVVRRTRPAKPGEYADLKDELVGIGYDDLQVAARVTRRDQETRKQRAAR